MRSDAEILRELVAECDQEAVGCDAKAQWLWAQDLDEQAEAMVQVGARHQARSRALSAALEIIDPVRVDPRPVASSLPPAPSLRDTLRLHVNPEKTA